jgi:hypothetical protein
MTDTAHYKLIADLILIAHATFVLFVVAGQVLILVGWARGWRWTRGPVWRSLHLAAIAVVVAEAWGGVICPLTEWEDRARQLAGAQGYEMGFIPYWLDRLMFFNAPAWVFTLAYSVFGLLVLASFMGHRPRRRHE